LVCLGPGGAGDFEVGQTPRGIPAADEVEIAVSAASVNPIDVRRAEGYGLRLLSLVGAGKFPMVLGNDFAGTVATIGARVSTFKPGDQVYGLKPASADATHASHILVKAAYILRAPHVADLQALAALSYSFVTMWRAVHRAGLTRTNALGKRVLIDGAAGGLGTLALQMLSAWGAKISAIARPPTLAGCSKAGAAEVLDGTHLPFASLGRKFDATFNFATWDDDLALVRCLRDGALGHATTVHPLLGNFERYGMSSFSGRRSSGPLSAARFSEKACNALIRSPPAVVPMPAIWVDLSQRPQESVPRKYNMRGARDEAQGAFIFSSIGLAGGTGWPPARKSELAGCAPSLQRAIAPAIAP
jgi:NADPH:quinone reductase-like Zn-dependent oxidoreductase